MRIARLFLMAAALALDACNEGDSASAAGPTFVTTLAIQDVNGALKQRFAVGEPIQFVLTVRNRRNESIEVQVAGACMAHELMVAPAHTTTPVWNSGANIFCIAAPQPVMFAAFETKTFVQDWDQRADSGQPVPIGSYEAFGTLGEHVFPGQPASTNSELGSQLQAFEIN